MTAFTQDDAWIEEQGRLGRIEIEDEVKRAANKVTYPEIERFTCGDKQNKFDHVEFSEYLCDDESFITARDNEELYIYKCGIYTPNAESYIKERVSVVMGHILNNVRTRNETIAQVKVNTYTDRDGFDSDPDIINLANGLYHVSSGEFTPHTPKHVSLRKSAVQYDADATCPGIDEFITNTVEPSRVQTMYEIAGYALMSRKRMKRGFIFYGKSDAGKTQARQLFKAFVGADQTCAVTPHELMNDTHASAALYGRLLNAVDDLGNRPLNDTGTLKAMIGEGDITYNQKNKPAFTFTPNAMVLWCTNNIPKTDDVYLRDKYDIIKFPYMFVNDPKEANEKKRVIGIIESITTPTELSGFFNKAMIAYRLAAERGDFTGSGGVSDREKMWRISSSSTARFVEECCDVTDTRAFVSKAWLNDIFSGWVYDNHVIFESKGRVSEYLSSINIISEKRVVHKGKGQVWCYVGISVIGETESP